jgi:hypothetical protein
LGHVFFHHLDQLLINLNHGDGFYRLVLQDFT